ncbi:hypothetical protein QJQ45_023624, partial [Haematococcus lacustris]
VVLKVLQQVGGGCTPDVVENGLEVLKALETKSYDLILMDIHMPLMDGLEATRRIVAQYPRGGAAAHHRPVSRHPAGAARQGMYVQVKGVALLLYATAFHIGLAARLLLSLLPCCAVPMLLLSTTRRTSGLGCREAGIEEFIVKPFRVEDLKRVVSTRRRTPCAFTPPTRPHALPQCDLTTASMRDATGVMQAGCTGGTTQRAGLAVAEPGIVYSPMQLREVGHLASWSVTSAKPGNGIELLRDGRSDTFWQSDGLQPHFINMQFAQRMQLMELHLHLDYKLDESYTPGKLSVRAGYSIHDVREVRVVELLEPSGWVVVPLSAALPASGADADPLAGAPSELQPLQVFCLQLAILSNHQNGRDSHVREVKVYALQREAVELPARSEQVTLYSTLR